MLCGNGDEVRLIDGVIDEIFSFALEEMRIGAIAVMLYGT